MKPWENNETGKYIYDSKALLFNLTIKRFFKCKQPENAIYCHKNSGAYFGGEKAELAVYSDRNGNFKCISHSHKIVYQIETNDDDVTNLLTNQLKD